MSPYRAPDAIGSSPAALLVDARAALPAVCLKCGSPYGLVARPARLSMRPTYTLPLCRGCDERRENARKALQIAAMFLAVGVVGAPFNARTTSDLIGVPVMVIVGFALVFVLMVRPRRLRVSETPQGQVLLKDVHPAAAELVQRTAARF